MPSLGEQLQCHRSLPFPPSTGDDRLDDLLLELAEYDGHIVGLAWSVQDGSRKVDEAIFDNGLIGRVMVSLETSRVSQSLKETIVEYVKSLTELRSLLEQKKSANKKSQGQIIAFDSAEEPQVFGRGMVVIADQIAGPMGLLDSEIFGSESWGMDFSG